MNFTEASEIGSTPLRWVRISPNTEAELLKRHLGIDFPSGDPSKVELGLRNRLVLFATQPMFRDPLIKPSIGPFRKPPGYRAMYSSGFNAVFYWEEGQNMSLARVMWGNTLSYCAQNNPTLYRQTRKFYPEGSLPPERWGAYTAFLYGLPPWMCVEALTREEEITDDESISYNHLLTISGGKLPEEKGEEVFDVRSLDNDFYLVQQAVASYQALVLNGQLTPNQICRAHDVNLEAKVRIGHYFVYRTLRLLQDKGLTTPKALEVVIKNPPNKLPHLIRPLEYLQSL